jgi:hypothetical protein
MAFEMDKGLITDIKKLPPDYNSQAAFAFLGDLLDNNPFSIRLMESMINLKKKNPNRVILLGGNRDFNKLRMGIELFLHNTSQNNSLPWTETKTIQELLAKFEDTNNTFEFRHEGIPDYLKDVGEWDKIIKDKKLDIYNNKTDISGRLNSMYANTLGIKDGTKHMKKELENIFGISLYNYSPQVLDKLFCTIHMIMAFNWSCFKLPAYLSRFNALYQNYLTACHVIAGFTMNGKTGILSHGSIPIQTINENNQTINRSLTYPFGYDATNTLFTNDSKKYSLPGIISMIELEKQELMTEYQKLRNTQYTYDNFPMVTKFVHLTATTKDNQYPQAGSQHSPVVWGNQEKDLTKYPDISLRLSGQNGGDGTGFKNWVNRDKSKPHYTLDNGNDIVNYNIFGHSPAYFNPIYHRKQHTLHVNLDISKAELQSNSSTFAFLLIHENYTMLIGRIQFTQIDSNKADGSAEYKNNTGYATEAIRKELSGLDHYYSLRIPDGSVNLSMKDNILGLPYKVGKGEGYNKLIQ